MPSSGKTMRHGPPSTLTSARRIIPVPASSAWKRTRTRSPASAGSPATRTVRGDDLEDVVPVAEGRAIDRVEVLAQLVFQQVERALAECAVIDRVFEFVVIA